MIAGAHAIVFADDAERAPAFFGDVLGLRSVDAGEGWLIFALPRAELGVHPADDTTKHELSLMCDDVHATVAELRGRGVELRGEPQDLGFGVGTTMLLPGGVEVLLYEPRHATPG